VYGWSGDDFIGQPIKKIVPPERHEQADDLLRRCRSGEDVRNVEGLRVSRGGEIFTVLLTLSLLKDDSGQPAAIATFAKDIGELKEAQAQLSEYSHSLEEQVQQRTADLAKALDEVKEANSRLEHELRVARALSEQAGRQHEVALVGESIAVRALREAVEAYAAIDDPLLLAGPPGAGQEATARAIHRQSSRSQRPFIFINCARVALDQTNALFSTGAHGNGDQVGQANLADRGTLYLEAVETLSQVNQARLLAYLLDSAARRKAGEVPEPDIRLIAHSARDLQEEVRQGNVIPDLAKTLSLKQLTVPPLVERREDIPIIAERVVNDRARTLGKVFEGIAPESLERLCSYSWPGNVGELQSVLERAVVRQSGPWLTFEDEVLDSGVQIGGYHLVSKLGSGGMGDVWLANHDLLARPAAVKLLKSNLQTLDPTARHDAEQRFRREAEVTAQLRSPHTVELYDFGITETGEIYYVMEHLSGLDLAEMVQLFGPFEPERVVYLLSQACLSLGEAHEAGLVHRDIKPQNLFVSALGLQRDFLKVLDFGIAKALESTQTNLTADGAVAGTPGFIAPEAFMGRQDPDHRVDLYALGCVAYYMLAGMYPFEGRDAVDLVRAQMVTNPGSPSDHSPYRVPRGLDKLIHRAMRREPSRRQQSASEMRDELLGIRLKRPWTEERATRWWSQNEATIIRKKEDEKIRLFSSG
jgi:PAS domain S-box-containing protein